MAKYNYTVTADDSELSIKQLIKREFNFSNRFKTKMKYQNLVDLNGTPTPGFKKPVSGDVISIRLPEERSNFIPEDIPVSVLYEDDDLMLIDKQPGLIIHPTKGHPAHTLANGVMQYVINHDQHYKIRFVNRLDMDTSGIVIIAKNPNTQDNLQNQMKADTIHKKYIAIVKGIVKKDEFTIDLPIGRPSLDAIARQVLPEGGQESVTDVKVLERYNSYTLVELTLHTGRTHQIRVHLSHIGHPVIGDHLYGGDAPWLIDRQALHAYYISFIHPITNERIEVSSPYPEDIKKCLKQISGK